jgi:small-conductance mechanosensitive channel
VGTVYGKVMRYGLLSTVIKTNDGVLVHVPNRDMNIMAVTNMSLNDIIRVTVRFHINKNADISKSISVVKMQYTPHQAYASKANQGMDQ